MSLFSASYVLLWILVIIQGALIFTLVQWLSEVRARRRSAIAPPRDGDPAPLVSGLDVRKHTVVALDTLRDRLKVLVFVSAECNTCARLVQDLRQLWPTSNIPRHAISFVCTGTPEACAEMASDLPIEVLVVSVNETDIAFKYGVSGFPIAFLVDETWTITGIRHPSGADDVRIIFEQLLAKRDLEAYRAHEIAS